MFENYLGNRIKVLAVGTTYSIQVLQDSYLDEPSEWQTVAFDLSYEALMKRLKVLIADQYTDSVA